MVDLTTIFPDAPRAVHELRKAGMKTGIVSTKYRYRIEAILARDGLTDGFDVIVGGRMSFTISLIRRGFIGP